MKTGKEISASVIGRLPRYYRFLCELQNAGEMRISSAELSKRMGLTASQIRQDFNCFGGFGQQGYGYNVEQLKNEMAAILGLDGLKEAILIGSGITGLGGVLFVLDYGNGTWATASASAIESLAWLSVALVIFVRWNPVKGLLGAFIFGMCYWAYNYIPSLFGIAINTQLMQMLPYIVTIIVLILGSVHQRREAQGPEYLGRSYFREDR